MRLNLSYYRNELLTTNRGNCKGKISNAKPFLLLALFDLIENGLITENKLFLDSDVLKDKYQCKAKSFERNSTITPFHKPFFHLNSEPYYHIIWKGNSHPNGASKTPSVKYLREHVAYATLDEALWELLQDEGARNEIKGAIIDYFIKPIKEQK
ncbi:MAG: hypothetical protein ACFNYJ_08240 [Segatella oris]|jgi:hypothetical protein|uniref:hypothetical protein n=1 Tax=Prevotella falsenii TaxID=515414 RepID=UPI00046A46D8|nr:hypothetical protein [Prevotella falsenii]